MNQRVSDGSTRTSRAMQSLRAAIERCAASHATVLITGETGTGKGVVARAIHSSGPRRSRPFVHLDCAALSLTVVESELFGHERGAFTDAVARRAGRLELADGGTLFLDEIGDMDLRLQAKLLRVLEEREFERVGGTQTLPLEARVIAATHRDLPAMVEAGEFRADLFYRLDVLHIAVPPLRERLGELPRLARSLLARSRGGAPPPPLTESALARLCSHGWPGNVRELANVLERCTAVASAEPGSGAAIDVDMVEAALARGPGRTLRADGSDRDRIAAELVATGGNVRRTARRLGLARGTLRYRIARYELGHLLPKG